MRRVDNQGTSGAAPLERERRALLRQWENWLEMPMLALGLVWLVLLVIELTRGLTPLLETVGTVIWATFILDFLLKLTLAPRKGVYLAKNWLTVLALLVPALRVVRCGCCARPARRVDCAFSRSSPPSTGGCVHYGRRWVGVGSGRGR